MEILKIILDLLGKGIGVGFIILLVVILIKLIKNFVNNFCQYRLVVKITYLIGTFMAILTLVDLALNLLYYGNTNNIPSGQIPLFFWFGKIAEFLTILGVGLSIVVVADTSNLQIKNDKQSNEIRDKTNEIIVAIKKLEEITKIQTDRYRELKIMLKKVDTKRRQRSS